MEVRASEKLVIKSKLELDEKRQKLSVFHVATALYGNFFKGLTKVPADKKKA